MDVFSVLCTSANDSCAGGSCVDVMKLGTVQSSAQQYLALCAEVTCTVPNLLKGCVQCFFVFPFQTLSSAPRVFLCL